MLNDRECGWQYRKGNNLDGLLQMLAINRQKKKIKKTVINRTEAAVAAWGGLCTPASLWHAAFAEYNRLIKKKEAPC